MTEAVVSGLVELHFKAWCLVEIGQPFVARTSIGVGQLPRRQIGEASALSSCHQVQISRASMAMSASWT